jgi:hypothetical protein
MDWPQNLSEAQIAELRKLNPPRPCGECTLCCEVIGVVELRKPYYAPCEHCTAGCSIYDSRPRSCRHFQCMWTVANNPRLHSLFKDHDRPDRSGFVFDIAIESETRILDVYEARRVSKDEARNAFRKAQRVNKKLCCEVIRYTPYRAGVPVSHSVDPKYGLPQVKPGPSNYWITEKDGLKIFVAANRLPKHLSFLD